MQALTLTKILFKQGKLPGSTVSHEAKIPKPTDEIAIAPRQYRPNVQTLIPLAFSHRALQLLKFCPRVLCCASLLNTQTEPDEAGLNLLTINC